MIKSKQCTGNGECIKGLCQCDKGYGGFFCQDVIQPNSTFVPNATEPTAAFEANGYLFGFSMVAIEELDSNRVVAASMMTNRWMFNQTMAGDLTTLTYTLNTTRNYLGVTTTIEHSDNQRVLDFAGLKTTLPPNSIKIAVNVTGWQYKSALNTIRLVFQTQVGDVEERSDCDDRIPEGNHNALGDINYLRIRKDNVIFYGHFLLIGLSDGRRTYSKNEVINQTTDSTIANIGINMPQCSECLIDPSFSVLITPTLSSDCGQESKSKTWLIATINIRLNKEKAKMTHKLKQMDHN
eukprot:gene7332-8538_t